MSDLISRQAAKKIIYEEFEGWPTDKEIAQRKRLTEQLDELPSVEPERKPGIWTHEDTGVWTCGVCGEEVGEMGDEYGVPKYNFCPYCGADMTGRRVRNDR